MEFQSPEIDPYWYVGRGVRPIGRFGKRQMRNKSSLQPRFIGLFKLILSHLKKQDGLNLDNPLEEESCHKRYNCELKDSIK
ncbi:unnamed protein product [Ranitomeya imitator]|uniref:Prolactin-releasing peptide n=1 Tax=Ranitomeya imitator TaxID=111125 RepID=A0ABN9LDA8_9NEOB|nr:unnamed protein product [Ranitomeya imitator]